MSDHHDDFADEEPVPGLPEALPADEQMLWQGSPDWRSLALQAFHVRKVGIYFGVLILWVTAAGIYDGMPREPLMFSISMLTLLGALAMGVLTLLAYFNARCAIFTLTSRRVIVRFGVAMRMTLNLPLQLIDGAALKKHADGTGDIPLLLSDDNKLSWVVLWPFARPWRISAPEIMLRSLRDADTVAQLLGERLNDTGESIAATQRADTASSPAGDRRRGRSEARPRSGMSLPGRPSIPVAGG